MIPLNIWPCYRIVHVYLALRLVGGMWSIWVEANLCMFFYHFVLYALLLETQLSRGPCWDTITPFYPATLLCLSQARACVFDVICRGRLWVQWAQLRWEVILHFADICGIDDHHCLAFLSKSVRRHVLVVAYSHVTYRYTLYYWLLIHFRVWHYCNCRKPW